MVRSSQRVGPYRLERRIASGGMAEVHAARREGAHGFERRLAIKTILPQLASDPEFVAMFTDEARLAARLEHPAIAQVFDFGEADGTLFLAMELVDGASVNRLLRATTSAREPTPIPLSVILHVGIEVARALAYAHHARGPGGEPLGVVHRDVSPANILLGRRGEVKLVDFGIARCAGASHRTDEGMVRGKLGYMSPEQVLGKPIDKKSDVFTLAAVLAELCLLEPLFGTGEDLSVLMRIRNVEIEPLDRLLATEEARRRSRASAVREGRPHAGQVSAPPELLRLLRSALVRKPEDRIDASHLADGLEEIAERRRLAGRRARDTARLLHRLGLVSHDGADVDAREPGARPTALVEPGAEAVPRTGTTDRPRPPGTNELLAAIALEPSTTYEITAPNGVVLGPLSYAELVRRLVAGEVGPGVSIRREGADGEPPELRRYLGSRALGWLDPPTGDASVRRGPVAPSSLLGLALELTTTRATGRLEVVQPRGLDPAGTARLRRKRIFFVDGRPEFVASNDPDELLGEFLVRHGVCLRMELDMALAVLHRYDGRLVDALVGIGAVRPLPLVAAIERQVRERYLEVFRWAHGSWSFVPGLRAGEDVVPLGRSPLELLLDATLGMDGALAEAALAPLRERVITRSPAPPAPLAAFGAPEAWSRALASVDGRTSLASLLLRAREAHGLDDEEAHRVYCFGLGCGILRANGPRDPGQGSVRGPRG
jgi:serine/threonine-protein kinase